MPWSQLGIHALQCRTACAAFALMVCLSLPQGRSACHLPMRVQSRVAVAITSGQAARAMGNALQCSSSLMALCAVTMQQDTRCELDVCTHGKSYPWLCMPAPRSTLRAVYVSDLLLSVQKLHVKYSCIAAFRAGASHQDWHVACAILYFLRGDPHADSPILALTRDQGSYLFASYMHLANHVGLRLVWFPDSNHCESNTEKGILAACGMAQVSEKSQWLSRLNNGLVRGRGQWFMEMKHAHQASKCVLHVPHGPCCSPPIIVCPLKSQYVGIAVSRDPLTG